MVGEEADRLLALPLGVVIVLEDAVVGGALAVGHRAAGVPRLESRFAAAFVSLVGCGARGIGTGLSHLGLLLERSGDALLAHHPEVHEQQADE